jgi:hypothetical protein
VDPINCIRLCIGESTLPANDEGASSDKLG